MFSFSFSYLYFEVYIFKASFTSSIGTALAIFKYADLGCNREKKFNPYSINLILPSLIMSRNQNDIENTTINKAKNNTLYELLKLCIDNAPLRVKLNRLKLV